jgi:mannitol-1-phosphate/altronate dehydrogenase
MVTDVEPYELMKLRLLDAGHQALGYFGYLLGHRLVHEAGQDPPLAAFVRRGQQRGLRYCDLYAATKTCVHQLAQLQEEQAIT